MATVDNTPWFLKSTHPVDFPFTDAFTLSKEAYQDLLSKQLQNSKLSDLTISDDDESTIVDKKTADDAVSGNAFMDGLKHQDDINSGKAMPVGMEGKMLTANRDVAVADSGDALVDLFYEVESSVSGSRLESLLDKAWKQDSLKTLKIIFNARSIHLGKSERKVFYQCAGWLATHHPQTLIANLGWLVRPVIPKKAEKKEDSDDVVIVEAVSEDANAQFDVKNGVSHGYWKDVLNILALAANGKLDVHSEPADVLNVVDEYIKAHQMKKRGHGSSRPAKKQKKEKKDETAVDARVSRKELREQRHTSAVAAFENNAVYRMLHVEVARLFAQQLSADIRALRGDDAKAKKNISLCAKWAPSDDLFHDKHTFIVSSIAEIMHPRDSLDAVKEDDSRVVYLRHAREQYRRDVSALRKHLDVVERNITAKTYDKINYARLPSQAMMNYQTTFVQKDTEHFLKYLDEVADGKKKISGATLMPSILVSRAFKSDCGDRDYTSMTAKQIVEHKVSQAGTKVLDGQWKSLVQRIKDSGSLDDCIAVCDVSGSMTCNGQKDGTTPLDAAIGLSLLMAEVVKSPFGGHFITFSDNPELVKIDLTASLSAKIRHMNNTSWDMSTNFRGVFEDLILPMAKANNLKQEDMIKKVFVFSDMQFNSAQTSSTSNRWNSSYEDIKAIYKDAGYEMPELVFWNLAGPRMGSGTRSGASAKPTDAAEEGVALVSGYSQGMLKVFMDGAGFDDEDEKRDEDEMELVNEDGETETVQTKKKDPRDLVNRAVSHKAYDMLQVWD